MEIMKPLRMTKDTQEIYSLKQKILQITEQTWKEVKPKVEEKYPTFDFDSVRVELNPRLQTTGGRASLRGKRIELNEKLLSYNLEHVRMVFIHELSHLIDYHVRRKSNHDNFFLSVMESLGCEGTTHMPKGLDTTHIKKRKSSRKYVYQCVEGCEHLLTAHKHNKIQRGATYTCRISKKPLQFKTTRGLIG